MPAHRLLDKRTPMMYPVRDTDDLRLVYLEVLEVLLYHAQDQVLRGELYTMSQNPVASSIVVDT